MDRYVVEQNITRFADRFCTEADPGERAKVRRLMLEEEKRFGFRVEQLGVLDVHIANCKDRITRQRAIIESLEALQAERLIRGRPDRTQSDQSLDRARQLLATLLELHGLFESYRRQIVSVLDRPCLSEPGLHHVAPPSDTLTRRELEVLTHVSRGRSSREIADLLGLTERTVSVHRQSICAKLRVVNSVAAVAVAIRAGILKS